MATTELVEKGREILHKQKKVSLKVFRTLSGITVKAIGEDGQAISGAEISATYEVAGDYFKERGESLLEGMLDQLQADIAAGLFDKTGQPTRRAIGTVSRPRR